MAPRSNRRAREREAFRMAKRARRLNARGATGLSAGAALGATVLFAPAAEAATFNVTNLNDSGAGSLRQAVLDANAANGDDVVTFATGLSGTIQLSSVIPVTEESLDVQGPGASQLTVRGGGTGGIFTLQDFDEPQDTVRFAGLTLTNGSTLGSGGAISSQAAGAANIAASVLIENSVVTGNHADGNGGAFYSFYSELTIRDSQITNNTADGHGGGIYLYGGNKSGTTPTALTIVGSTISGNTAGKDGGGVYSEEPDGNTLIQGSTFSNNTAHGQGGGAKVYSDTTGSGGGATDVTIEDSTFIGNHAAGSVTEDGYGGGLVLYGHKEVNSVTISGTTFASNQATGGGGGGVMLWGTGAPLVIEDSTFTGNAAGENGGNYDGGGAIASYNAEDLPRTIRNSTIVGNSSTETGGGISRQSDDSASYAGPDVLTLQSTIVSGNTAPDGPDLGEQDSGTASGSFDVGFSLIGSTTGATVTESPSGSNQVGVDPQLGPLADNGGPTQTLLPALTSPVIDAGNANGLTTDQRGLARTADLSAVANHTGSDGSDIGAVEVAGASCQGAVVFADFRASEGDDILTGTTGPDSISALGGNDTAKGAGGNDCVSGDDGKDKLRGQGGKDIVKGGAGNDNVAGGGGKDKLRGNAGKDVLKARDRAKDKVNCGGGKDKATVDAKDKVSKNCEKVKGG